MKKINKMHVTRDDDQDDYRLWDGEPVWCLNPGHANGGYWSSDAGHSCEFVMFVCKTEAKRYLGISGHKGGKRSIVAIKMTVEGMK